MGLLLSALALWVFAQIADEVLEQETQTFDQSILLAIRQMHTPIGDRMMLGITFLGEPVFLLLICLGIGIRLLYYHRRSQATTLARISHKLRKKQSLELLKCIYDKHFSNFNQ
jgi:undecaprenyl-diphosphatase